MLLLLKAASSRFLKNLDEIPLNSSSFKDWKTHAIYKIPSWQSIA